MATPPATASIPASVTSFLAEKHRLFINGREQDAQSDEAMDIIDPSTGKAIASAPLGGAADIDAAVKAARKAFDEGPWPRMQPPERRRLVMALADALEAEIDDFCLIDSLNMGMPIGPSRAIIGDLSIESLRYCAGWIGKVSGEMITTSVGENHAYTLKEPMGVIGAIVPWNSPLLGAMGKLAPAISAGCTVVLKPSELTPLTMFKFAKLVQKVGIPEGVINIVNGLGPVAGQALIDHPGVDKIAFTGSTAVGRTILRASESNFKRVALELGGKSPVYIFADADIDLAVTIAGNAIFRNAGQVCAAGSRLYVHGAVYDKVMAGLIARAQAIKVGGALEPGVDMGPIVSEKQRSRVLSYIDAGRKEGAEVVAGGGRMDRDGFFASPTVLAKTNRDMTVVKEEIFGPVVSVQRFETDNLDEAAALGHDTPYGLAGYIVTKNVSTVHRMAKKLRAGMIMVNGGFGIDRAVPFGGFKQSGWGREYGKEGFEAYLETKSVIVGL